MIFLKKKDMFSQDGIQKLYAEDKNHNGIDDSTEKHYSVKFIEGDSGTLTGKILYENILTGLTFSEAGIEVPTIKANEGYISLGWDKEPTGKIESDLTFVALYQKEPVIEPEVNETVIPVEENVPKTGDNIYTWIIVSILSLQGLLGISLLLRISKK